MECDKTITCANTSPEQWTPEFKLGNKIEEEESEAEEEEEEKEEEREQNKRTAGVLDLSVK